MWDVEGGDAERILTEAMLDTQRIRSVRTLTVLNGTPGALPVALAEGVPLSTSL